MVEAKPEYRMTRSRRIDDALDEGAAQNARFARARSPPAVGCFAACCQADGWPFAASASAARSQFSVFLIDCYADRAVVPGLIRKSRLASDDDWIQQIGGGGFELLGADDLLNMGDDVG